MDNFNFLDVVSVPYSSDNSPIVAPVWAYVILIVGAVIFLAALALIIYFFVRKDK